MLRISWWILGAVVCTLLASPAPAAQTTNITILYTGDTQAHLRSFFYDSMKPVGGIAKRAIFFQDKRRHRGMTWLTLDSGDALSGTPLGDVFQGYLSIQAMNMLGYDGMTVGVHDFDFGTAALQQRISEAAFPVLSANIKYADSGMTFTTPYVVLERDGTRIAILGLSTGEMAQRVAPENFTGLTVEDPVQTAQRLIPQLQTQADVIVALTHIGINEDIRLASEVRGIDVIVGGMSHSELQVPMKFEDTLIVHDSEYGHSVGMLKLSFDPTQSYRRVYFHNVLEEMGGKWVENTDYLAWLDSFNEQLRQRMEVIVGTSAGPMSDMKMRSAETPLGNYVTDIMRELTQADVALLPAAFFQGPLPEGAITLGDLYTALPFDQYTVVLEVTGGELKQVLDQAAAQIGRPGFPQLSGASFGILGGSAYLIRVAGEELDLFAQYKLATCEALAEGGYGYAQLGSIGNRAYTGRLVRDLVRQRLATGHIAQSSVYQRITFHAYDPTLIAATPPTGQPATPPSEEASSPPEVEQPAPATEEPVFPAAEEPVYPEEEEPVPATEVEPPVAEPEPLPPESAAEPVPGEETAPAAEEPVGLDALRYDRTGAPLGEPVVVEDEVITDVGSGLEGPSTTPPAEPPAETTEAAEAPPVIDLPSAEPEGMTGFVGATRAVHNGLEYVFTLVPKGDEYEFRLQITNPTTIPVEINYDTEMKFDYIVKSGNDVLWNYNYNRFYMQSQRTETIAPGETLNFRGQWDGLQNNDSALPTNNLRFEAEHHLREGAVRVSFDAVLPQ